MPTITITDDTDLHFIDEGSGDPALVLLHGFPLRSDVWQQQVGEFAAGRRVVAPDLRGFGESGTPGERITSVDPYANDVLRLIDDLGLERVVLVGHCLGAYVALDLMRLVPNRVGALVLVSAPFGPLPEEERLLDEQRAWLGGGRDLEYFIDWVGEVILAPDGLGRGDVGNALRTFTRDASREGLIDGLHALQNRAAVIPDWQKIEIPTLLLYGEHDQLIDREQMEATKAAIRESRLEVVPDGGHVPQFESRGWFNRHLGDFLGSL